MSRTIAARFTVCYLFGYLYTDYLQNTTITIIENVRGVNVLSNMILKVLQNGRDFFQPSLHRKHLVIKEPCRKFVLNFEFV